MVLNSTRKGIIKRAVSMYSISAPPTFLSKGGNFFVSEITAVIKRLIFREVKTRRMV